MMNEKKQSEKLSLSKENPNFYRILVVAGLASSLINTLLTGSASFFDFILQAVGYMGGTIIISWIIGIIPFLILHKKIKNARIKIYGSFFLFFCILTVIGNLYRN